MTPARGIDRREFFHGQNRLEENCRPWPAVLLGDLDAHQAPFRKNWRMMSLRKHRGIVHLSDIGADLLACELAHGGFEKKRSSSLSAVRGRGEFRALRQCPCWKLTLRSPAPRHWPALRFGDTAVGDIAVVGV